jgi:hypothetical protein
VQLRREHSRERQFTVDRLAENVFDCSANFRPVAIDNPALLALLERAARHHFDQYAVFPGRVVEHLCTNRFGLAEVCQQRQLVIDLWLLHRQRGGQVPATSNRRSRC